MSPREGETPEQFAGRLIRREALLSDLYFWIAWSTKALLLVGCLLAACWSWVSR